MASGYVPLPAFRAPRPLNFSGLNEGIDALGQGFKENRLLSQNKEIGNALQSGDYNAGAKAAFGYGDLNTGMQLQNAQRDIANTQYQRQRQEAADKRAAASEGRAATSFADDRRTKLISSVAGIAERIRNEADPERKSAMVQAFVSSHPRLKSQLDSYKFDPANPDPTMDMIIAEARGLSPAGKAQYDFTQYGVGNKYTGELKPYPQGAGVANAGAFKTPQDRIKYEQNLRKEYTTSSKTFQEVRDAAARVEASAKNASPAGDLALIFNYMKVLDPGSVVRESEFATAASSGSYGERIQGMVNRIITGERLTDTMREDFLNRSRKLYGAQANQFEKMTKQFRNIAGSAGVNSEDVILDYTPAPGNFPELDAGQANPSPVQRPRARNPETGEVVEYNDQTGQWEPVQ